MKGLWVFMILLILIVVWVVIMPASKVDVFDKHKPSLLDKGFEDI